MTDFLVKPGGPVQIRLSVPTDKGKATVSLPVKPHGAAGRISVPDKLADCIDPKQARFLVKLAAPAPEIEVSEDELAPEELKTIPATPDALKG